MVNMKLTPKFLASSLICPIILLSPLVRADHAAAAQCAAKACVDVYVENGQIVIEAHKGSGPTSKTVRKPSPKIIPKPQPSHAKPAPRPRAKTTYVKPKSAPAPRKVVPRKVAPKIVRKAAPRVSLSEKLIKLIPSANIKHEPSANVITNIPVIYWCDLPGVFSTRVAVIGEVVDVAMRASFLWSFGDGSVYQTTSPGAPFPNQVITHTYSRPGIYPVVLLATWGGVWTNNGVARAITGQIRKVSATTITVANAPTRLTQ